MFPNKCCRGNQNHAFFFINIFFPWKSSCIWDNVDKYCRAGQATNDYTAPAHCMVDTKVYKHTLRICNTCCFSYATVVTSTLPVPLENNEILNTITWFHVGVFCLQWVNISQYIYKEPTWCNLAVCLLLTAIILYTFRTLFASILRST
jgi:hypothetical protein